MTNIETKETLEGSQYPVPGAYEQASNTTTLERNAVRKLDILLIPILGIYFFLSFLDRANLGNVRIVGLQKDLHMTDYDYSMALTLTFIPYIIVDLPSNLLIRKIGAGIHLPLLVTLWGLVTCLQGLVTNYRGLLVCRFFLGFLEGGLYPGTVLYMSTFYTRTELQLRIATFWGTICMAGLASGLLTYAIINLDGRWGHPGWSWVFLIEGFVTSVFGILGFFILPSSIHKVKFLTDAEKSFLVSRSESIWPPSLASSPATAKYPTKSTVSQVWEACKSPHVIILNIAQFSCANNTYSLAYFTPTVVHTFGYSPTDTQLFTVPPFALGVVFLLGLSYCSDRYQARGLMSGISAILSIVGFAMFYGSGDDKVRYASLFLSIPGAYGVAPCLSAWTADNSAPHARKATALAFGTMVGNSGGLFSVWIFTLGRKPRYHLPTAISLAFGVMIIMCCVMNTLWLGYAQRAKVTKRSQILERYTFPQADGGGEADPGKEGLQSRASEQELLSAQAWDHLGDQHPDFKYVY
ncbi:hypothetical protein PGT21_035038 [Puccinia graminis f. sp. tritici]|uniref:Major facilitator superfamily (MFS) profile domain-containing protein n=1 Tax=Puccinia graminis f. sp. tritici TaxID=56615 RepID=A0A5B0N7Q7_PUCGR|nr:hypothetical protein PGTUg99_022720 [Puccinia graminis f. sp. tritici]KAA1084746.1 hypothetical protein PGT21_035038 [Puccinia graminis f. sp. tritici]